VGSPANAATTATERPIVVSTRTSTAIPTSSRRFLAADPAVATQRARSPESCHP
jgi:hypothetical protein